MDVFEDFMYVLQKILLTKKTDDGTGAPSKDMGSTREKANTGNSKVNNGCPPLTANLTSADCLENSPGPSIQYIPLVVYHTEGFNAMPNLPGATISFKHWNH